MATYYIYYNKTVEDKINDLQNNFNELVASPELYFKVTDNPGSVDTSIFKPLYYKESVNANNEKEALHSALETLQTLYFNAKPVNYPIEVYDFVSNMRLYSYETAKEDFKNYLKAKKPEILSELEKQTLRADTIEGYVDIVNKQTRSDFKLNPLVKNQLVANENFANEFITGIGTTQHVFLASTPVLAIHHSNYQNTTYAKLIDNLKGFRSALWDFWLNAENYFAKPNAIRNPDGNKVSYTKIEADNGVEFLSLNNGVVDKNFFVNLISKMSCIDKFQPDNPVEVKKFHYNRLVKVSENIDRLQKMYPDLSVIMYDDYSKEFTFMYSGGETTTVSLNDLIHKNVNEINKEHFDKSLANTLVQAVKKSFKR